MNVPASYVNENTTYGAIRDYILLTFGETVTAQTVTNYHQDAVKAHDPTLVAMIVDFYGLTLDDLPPDIQDRCVQARTALDRLGGPETDPGRATSS